MLGQGLIMYLVNKLISLTYLANSEDSLSILTLLIKYWGVSEEGYNVYKMSNELESYRTEKAPNITVNGYKK